jgi:prolyl-tRNA synthetase
MLQSRLFTKTIKEAPKDEVSANAKLLARGGFIDKSAAGIYSFLPLGLKVLTKIQNIIRQEMNSIGGQEILMPALQPKENWTRTGRWANFDALFKLKSHEEKEYALGATHEEIIAPLAEKFVFSYKDLPFYVYQIQTKFRDEARAKSGLLRGREFSMKDLYSFHASEENLDAFYDIVKDAYFKIFKRCGIDQKTYLTLASGGTFSKYSHEFQTVTSAGEDIIYICQKCSLALNQDIRSELPACPTCQSNDFSEAKAVEVGNIFKLGTKYSAPFGLKFRDAKGDEKPVIMGCYGIGPSRVMGAIVELCHDDKGIVWPMEAAPFAAHLLALGEKEKIKKEADALYGQSAEAGFDILYDDRTSLSAGEKFADADLIGIPLRLVVSEKTLEKDSFEIKKRGEKKTQLIKLCDLKNLSDLISSPASDSK